MIHGLIRPCRSGSCTWGRRMMETLTPLAATSAAASSDAARGKSLEATLGASSLARAPGGTLGVRGPRGHEGGRVGAGEDRAERRDAPPIGFAIRHEVREVVVEGEVD